MQDANGKESEEGGDDDYEEIQAVSRWLLPPRPPAPALALCITYDLLDITS